MIQQWICDVADARFFNTLSLFELVEQRQWCLQLRGIPDIVDLSFCRDLQRIIDGKIWLDAYWNRENDKDNMYILWRENKLVLRVIARDHFEHLLNSVPIHDDAISLCLPPRTKYSCCQAMHVTVLKLRGCIWAE